MRTYKLELGIELRAVVPDSFIAQQLELCRKDDANPFQRKTVAARDENLSNLLSQLDDNAEDYAEKYRDAVASVDDEFGMAIIKNGLRYGVRHIVVDMLTESGIGCHMAPVTVPVAEYLIPDEKEEPSGEVVS